MNIEEKYPALVYYLRCYLNQDFDVIFGSPDETLLAYKHTENIEMQLKIKKEIADIIDSSLNEIELRRMLLDEADCSYYYPDEWSSSTAWLKHILNILSE